MALQGQERELPWLCSFVESLSAEPIVLAFPALSAQWCHVWVLYPVPRGLSEVGLSVGAIHGIRRVKASLLCWVITIVPRVGGGLGRGGKDHTSSLPIYWSQTDTWENELSPPPRTTEAPTETPHPVRSGKKY